MLIDRADRPTRYEIIDAATDLCLETRYVLDISPLIMDESQYQSLVDHERRIVQDIQLEGIPIGAGTRSLGGRRTVARWATVASR
ncbi:MAG: hypothetical protein AB7S38_23655 [Vulcanimicrobiota bacterium]